LCFGTGCGGASLKRIQIILPDKSGVNLEDYLVLYPVIGQVCALIHSDLADSATEHSNEFNNRDSVRIQSVRIDKLDFTVVKGSSFIRGKIDSVIVIEGDSTAVKQDHSSNKQMRVSVRIGPSRTTSESGGSHMDHRTFQVFLDSIQFISSNWSEETGLDDSGLSSAYYARILENRSGEDTAQLLFDVCKTDFFSLVAFDVIKDSSFVTLCLDKTGDQ
jgi:hypothetical protein